MSGTEFLVQICSDRIDMQTLANWYRYVDIALKVLKS